MIQKKYEYIYKGVFTMVDYITGINGIGKTRLLAEAAAGAAKASKGSVVYIDCGNKMNLNLPAEIRLINAADYDINGAMVLMGFLLGLCASNYDLTDVFIDSTHKIINKDTNISDFMEIITKASESIGVNFHFAIEDTAEKNLVYQDVRL